MLSYCTGKTKFEWGLKEGFIVIKKDINNEWAVYTKQYLKVDNDNKLIVRTMRPIGVIPGFSTTQANNELERLFERRLFEYSKPHELIKYLIGLATMKEDDIVLDFFAGSGTTAQAVLKQNIDDNGCRKFILVQLPEPTPEDSEAQKAGYKTISAICRERVKRVIKKIKKEASQEKLGENKGLDLGFKAFTLSESNFKAWKGVEGKDAKKYAEQMALYVDPLKSKWKVEDVIWEVALKEGFGLCSKIEKMPNKENSIYKVTEPQKRQTFLICLDGELNTSAISALNLKKGDLFFCRDAALSDELAANMALQCRLKTI
jgi:adenine-specific DNA-methyltransferase